MIHLQASVDFVFCTNDCCTPGTISPSQEPRLLGMGPLHFVLMIELLYKDLHYAFAQGRDFGTDIAKDLQ
jgi:hypothetical protein